jgi:hypothetical protein
MWCTSDVKVVDVCVMDGCSKGNFWRREGAWAQMHLHAKSSCRIMPLRNHLRRNLHLQQAFDTPKWYDPGNLWYLYHNANMYTVRPKLRGYPNPARRKNTSPL